MQIYDKFGEKSGDLILVDDSGAESAEVIILADETILVAYTNFNEVQDTAHISVREYDFNGRTLAYDEELDGLPGNIVAAPKIAAAPDGGFYAAAHSFIISNSTISIYAASYERDRQGQWQGDVELIKDDEISVASEVLALDDGTFAVAHSQYHPRSGLDLYLTLHGETSHLPKLSYTIDAGSTTNQHEATLTLGSDGRIGVFWSSTDTWGKNDIEFTFLDSTEVHRINGSVYDARNSSNSPEAYVTADGNYFIAWASTDDGGGIKAQLFTPDKNRIGDSFQITYENDSEPRFSQHTNATIESYSDLGFAMTWELEVLDENEGSLHIGWFGILPELAFLSDGNDTAVGNNSADLIDLGDGKDHYSAGAGYDIVKGGVSADYIHGGNGWDRLFGERGADELWGGRGNDELNGGDKADYLNGGLGHDRLYGGSDDDELWGKNGNDFLFGGTGDDLIFGNSGNDELGGGDGDDTLNGGHGRDTLLGHAGNDVLNASNGADFLDGGLGDDMLTGGAGKDVFKFGSGADQISDFDTSRDRLLLDASLIGGAPDADDFSARAQVVGGDIVFSFDDGHSLTLIGVTDINLIESRIDIF